jgi:predicted aspartyl protease
VTLRSIILRQRSFRSLSSVMLITLFTMAAPQMGVAIGSAQLPIACGPGYSVVLHAAYGAYNDATIAVDADSVQEAYSSRGLDYGLTVGADEQMAWRVDENGVASSDVGDAKRDFMTLRAVLCNDLNSAGGEGEIRQEIARGGWPVSVQRDQRSGVISQVEYAENGTTQNIRVLQYGKLRNGAAVPTAWSVDGGQVVTVFKQDLVRGNARSATPNWPATPSLIRTGVSPLRRMGGRFVLDGHLGVVPINCMIDTGANNFAVSADLASSLDQQDSSQAGTHLVGGNVMTRVGRGPSIDIAGSTFDKPVVYVDSRLPPRTILCGADYLTKVRLRLDIASGSAAVAVGRGYKCASGCIRISDSGVARGDAMIGGQVFNVLFDTGYAGAIRLPPKDLGEIEYSTRSRAVEYCTGQTVDVELLLGGTQSTTWACPVNVDTRIPIAIGAEAFAAYRSVVIDYPDHLLQFLK